MPPAAKGAAAPLDSPPGGRAVPRTPAKTETSKVFPVTGSINGKPFMLIISSFYCRRSSLNTSNGESREQGFDKIKSLGKRKDGGPGEGRRPLSEEKGLLPSPGLLLPLYSCAKKRGPTLVTLPAPMVRKMSPGLRMPGSAATISSKFWK